jgi:hypothetical protein
MKIGIGDHVLSKSELQASMGPRPIGRGNEKPNSARTPLAMMRGFNGAATNWSRKFGRSLRPESHAALPVALQWGRDQLVAEILSA